MASEAENEDNEEKNLKLVFLGDSACGKTSLCIKFVQNKFSEEYNKTAGIDFYSKDIVLFEKFNVALQLWDVGGHNIASPLMLNTYIFDADAIVFVYDVTNKQSFENVFDWIFATQKIICNAKKKPQLSLVGNKTDLEHKRVVSTKKHEEAITKNKFLSFYTSAKTNDNVNFMLKSISAKSLDLSILHGERN